MADQLAALERLAFYSDMAVTITDERATILRVNQAFTHITGYTETEAVGKNPRILQSGKQDEEFYHAMWKLLLHQGSWQGRIWNRRKSGEIYSEWLQISQVISPDTEQVYYVAHFVDLHEVNVELEKWQNLAYHDSLTGVYNRSYLKARYHSWSAQLMRTPLILMMIDLDRFKSINDTYGHDAGDWVLKTVSSRIQQSVRPTDELARLGGDEFLLIIEEHLSASQLTAFCERIWSLITSPLPTDTQVFSVGASIGVAVANNPTDTFETLFHHADLAMYHAKQRGGGYVFFPFDHEDP